MSEESKSPESAARDEEIEKRAGAVIGLALEKIPLFDADKSGKLVSDFLKEHATGDEEADKAVACFIKYTLVLRRGGRQSREEQGRG